MSTRQQMFKDIGISPRGGAALDVGLMWAVNANAIPAAMWMLLGILLDKNLTDRVMAEIEPSFHEKSLSFDNDKLRSGPLLNSIYLEVLRVRVAAPVGRSSLVPNLKFGKWQIKQGVGMLSTSWVGGHDPDFWNTGSTLPDGSEEHPVDTFWAERFLRYEDDPTGGPVRSTNFRPSTGTRKRTPEDDRKASIVTEGTQGYFFPYGGGTKMCPGRFFAKQKLMASVALALRAYEIELVDPEGAAKVGPNMDYFPFGTIPPKGKVPARIRRRRL
jgi:cytochrome P450